MKTKISLVDFFQILSNRSSRKVASLWTRTGPWSDTASCVRCQNHVSDCDHITYSSTVTSAEFRWFSRWHTEYLDRRFWKWLHFHSSCDSRNLNLSPFCNLTSTSLAMWQLSVRETYGNQTTSYINATSGPMRRNFPNFMGERELISSLTKV